MAQRSSVMTKLEIFCPLEIFLLMPVDIAFCHGGNVHHTSLYHMIYDHPLPFVLELYIAMNTNLSNGMESMFTVIPVTAHPRHAIAANTNPHDVKFTVRCTTGAC